jgi:signal transduction histidine kinase
MLDALPDGVVVADGSGAVTLVNAAARGLLRSEDPLGRHLSDVVQLADRAGNSWFECTRPYAGLTTRTRLSEQAWYLSDGTELLLTGRLVRDSVEEPVRQVVLSLRSARARARLDRERSDLVATVAHELRSPLTGVKGFVQALLNRWDRLNDDQKKLMLTTVAADSDRLSRLIAELLDVARIDTGRLQLHPRPSDPAVLVGRVVDSVSAGTSRPILLETGDGLPQVTVDPDKFVQVVTNLLENAVRHGGGTVRVRLDALPGSGRPGIRLAVEDEGDGIAPELRRRVFTKFWRGGTTGGSGLGLYLVNGLVEAHGGAVIIDDTDGRGARVVVTLPSDHLVRGLL